MATSWFAVLYSLEAISKAPRKPGRVSQIGTEKDREGCRVGRDAPAGYVRPLIEPYVQFSRIRLSVWDP